MREIDGPGAVSGRFVDYDAVTNPNGTVYTADFGNDVQDELIGIQEAGGIDTGSAGTNLQVLEALRIVIPGYNPAVSDWTAGTYTAGDVVRYGWLDWWCNAASTTDTPAPETDWEPVKHFREKHDGWELAGWSDIFDPKSASFVNYCQVGKYTNNGVDYDRFRINIAGQSTVTNTSDFGILIASAKNNTKFATDNGSSYDLEDYRGCVKSAGDGSSGYRAANGTRQDHAAQRTNGSATTTSTAGIANSAIFSGVFVKGDSTSRALSSTDTDGTELGFDNAGQTGQTYNTSGDGNGNEGSDPGETFMNNVADGCGFIEVDIVSGTILTLFELFT